MADVHEPAVRSYNMSQIRSKNTKPEILVRKYLHKLGLRFRLHDKTLPGKPDIVLKKYGVAIFIHGCFWHAHEGCRYYVIPKTRSAWWIGKLSKNRSNDIKHVNALKRLGWKVINIWECDLKPEKRERTLSRVQNKITLIKSR